MEVKTLDPKISPKIGPNFAKNLNRLLVKNGLTAYRLAKETGISQRSIYAYLDPTVDSDPTASILLRLCRVLHCEIGELLSI